MVSNLSVIARVSLKAAAFFIEIILEAVKNSTGFSLGITRRALINAVGTARAVHSLTSGQVWDAKTTGRSGTTAGPSFLSILDKYTAVGIYLIHHTFTLAELFAMGSFQLVGTTLTAGIAVADESVRTIDGIFGSNETSRALASFISLVRGEVNNDPRFANDNMLSLLNKLTKAVTAFAVLQNSTYKRSAKSMKMRVVYDCTVLGEVEAKSWRSLMVGSGNFIRSRPAALLASAAEGLETLSLMSPPRRTASLLDPSEQALKSSASAQACYSVK
uniref:Lipase n=1 Tax=Kalmanozyma brasiliensis (strain GHG001) TaxID=1365824 RepID=V5F384_KALBG